MNCSSDGRGEGSGRDEPRSNLCSRTCAQVDKAQRVRAKVNFSFSTSFLSGKHIEWKHHLKMEKSMLLL